MARHTLRKQSVGAALTLLTTAALVLTACSGGGGGDDSDGAGEPPSSTDSPSDAAPDDGPESASTDAPGDRLTVTAAGHGPVAVTADADSGADTTTVSGKLIVGPGSCFALKEIGHDGQDAPRPLILPAGSEAVTGDGRPSVTLPGQDTTYIGTDITVDAAEVSVTDIDGFPEQCSHATGTTLLVSAG